jgi:hypothetical protein
MFSQWLFLFAGKAVHVGERYSDKQYCALETPAHPVLWCKPSNAI